MLSCKRGFFFWRGGLFLLSVNFFPNPFFFCPVLKQITVLYGFF